LLFKKSLQIASFGELHFPAALSITILSAAAFGLQLHGRRSKAAGYGTIYFASVFTDLAFLGVFGKNSAILTT
jgi:hypothetical protein